MQYLVFNPNLKGETLLTGASHKRFDAALRKATNAGIGWQYSFSNPIFLLIDHAPDGYEELLATYGTVKKFPDDVEVDVNAEISSV